MSSVSSSSEPFYCIVRTVAKPLVNKDNTFDAHLDNCDHEGCIWAKGILHVYKSDATLTMYQDLDPYKMKVDYSKSIKKNLNEIWKCHAWFDPISDSADQSFHDQLVSILNKKQVTKITITLQLYKDETNTTRALLDGLVRKVSQLARSHFPLLNPELSHFIVFEGNKKIDHSKDLLPPGGEAPSKQTEKKETES